MRTGFLVGDAMTKRPLVVSPQENVRHAAALMKKENVGSLVVLKHETILGIITQEDIVFKIVAEKKDPATTLVTEIMSKPVVTISPEKDIIEAISLMNHQKIRQLPVISEEKLIGYLTLKDILKIEPELLELSSDIFMLREELEKPVRKRYESGACDACGKDSKDLLEIRDVLLCSRCRKSLRPVING